ncbi:MAG: lipocalin family protein [Bdellovibrionota bacterium]
MKSFNLISVLFFTACASAPRYEKTVAHVEIDKFMGKWYVMAGRFTMFEKDVFNGIETYTLNPQEKRIDISFTYNKKSFSGDEKSLPQKGWIYNTSTNSHWKVSPLWPLKFDYLIVDLASDYSWTVIGVPDQAYVWIMARDYTISKSKVDEIIKSMTEKGYNMKDIVFVPHKY